MLVAAVLVGAARSEQSVSCCDALVHALLFLTVQAAVADTSGAVEGSVMFVCRCRDEMRVCEVMADEEGTRRGRI